MTFLHKGALMLPRGCPVKRSHFTKQFQDIHSFFLRWSGGDGYQAMWDTVGRLWPCLGTQLHISSSRICQAARGKVAPVHLFLYMALKSWPASSQHTFETETTLCFYTKTRTHIYSTSTSLTKIENIKEFTCVIFSTAA